MAGPTRSTETTARSSPPTRAERGDDDKGNVRLLVCTAVDASDRTLLRVLLGCYRNKDARKCHCVTQCPSMYNARAKQSQEPSGAMHVMIGRSSGRAIHFIAEVTGPQEMRRSQARKKCGGHRPARNE